MKQKPGLFTNWGEALRTLAIWALIAVLVIVFGALVGIGVRDVFAQECQATLTWTPPTENTDGTPLVDLAGFRAYWGPASDQLDNALTIDDATATTWVLEGLPDDAPAFFAVSAFNASGVESDLSNVASKVCPPAALVPLAPPIQVADVTVYDYVPTRNGAIALPVGQVSALTPCRADVAIVVDGRFYYQVDREAVTWFGNVRPPVVFAECQQ